MFKNKYDPNPDIIFLTVSEVPLTLARRIRKLFTGSVFSCQEKLSGEYNAMLHREEAYMINRTDEKMFQRAGDRQLLTLPFSVIAEHCMVQQALRQ